MAVLYQSMKNSECSCLFLVLLDENIKNSFIGNV